ncbi:MAG: RNA-binding protein [Paracoccus denitrificans]|uniref:RNA-binding protein n=1 Tax=Paracoccus denitrificans TaxID=266 RepID=A0A533IAS3_PARDE|nr:MAG: RNA-binding protein [Paracoccus denitrificans]
MTRGGRDKSDEGTERRCLVTGEVQPKAGLIRFVLGPDGIVVPDLAEKLPGRGFWLTADRAIIDRAIAKGAFSRGAKAQARPPEGLAEQIETGLAKRVIELISLARKSGIAIAGFEKVKDWLAAGRVKILLQASDGSERGKGRLWTPEGARWFGCLTASELGLAFGRDHVIHSALSKGGLADRIIRDAGRLNGLRGNRPSGPGRNEDADE